MKNYYSTVELEHNKGKIPQNDLKNGTPHSRYFSDELGVPNFLS